MNYRSSDDLDQQTKMKIENVRASSYRSMRDNCLVTLIKCEECARMFEDELEAAMAKIVSGKPLLCLSCDPRAEEPSYVVRLVIGFYW